MAQEDQNGGRRITPDLGVEPAETETAATTPAEAVSANRRPDERRAFEPVVRNALEAGRACPQPPSDAAPLAGRNFWSRARDEVSAWMGDQDAAWRRREDQFSQRGKAPSDYARTDERIREDVCEELSEDPILDASGIDVVVENSEVTLNGETLGRQEKRRAEDIAERCRGVRHVQNNLRFEGDEASAGCGAKPGPPVSAE